MIIRSNPRIESEGLNEPIGRGEICLNVTFGQLELISAYLMLTRLGDGKYEQEAFNLIESILSALGTDFLSAAVDNTEINMTIADSTGSIVIDTSDGEHFGTIEVV